MCKVHEYAHYLLVLDSYELLRRAASVDEDNDAACKIAALVGAADVVVWEDGRATLPPTR